MNTDSERTPPAPQRRQPRPPRPGRIIVLALFAIPVFLILKQEVPQVDDWYQQMVNKERWAAADYCRAAALRAASNPETARIVERGTVHATAEGFMIEGVVVGEMGESGAEQTFKITCYADADGVLINTHKLQ